MSGLRYQPALDGVRAMAVIAVVAFHGGVPGFAGGYLGVDLFFVLSGFLITTLLVRELTETGGVRLAAFWGRRARRLLPALLLMLAVVVPVARYALPPADFAPLRLDALAALGYVANWRMIWRGTDYFTVTGNPSLVQHTWSLGIEEQFYAFWPLIVVALALLWPGRRWRYALLGLCVAGTAASAAVAAFLVRPQTSSAAYVSQTALNRAYFGTDTRAQALLVGAALAVALHLWRPAAGRTSASLAVVGALVMGWFWYAARDPAVLFQGWMLLFALAAAAVLAHLTAAPTGRMAGVLAVAPLAWLGRISYGVYLWHWPVFELLNADRTGWLGPRLLAARVAVTVLIAAASYYALELPVRRLPMVRLPAVTRPRLAAGMALAYLCAAGLVLLLPARVSPPAASAAPVVVTQGAPPAAHGPVGSAVAPLHRAGRKPGTEPRATFFGDSVAWTIGAYLPPHPGLAVTNRAIQGCGIATLPDILQLGTPHTNYPGCTRWQQRWQAAVNADDPDVAVVLLNRWELMDRRLDGSYQHVGQSGYDAYLRAQLDRAITVAGSRGATVVLLTAAYTHRAEQPDGSLYPEDQPSRVDAWNRLLTAERADHPTRVRVLDLNQVVCPAGRFTWSVHGLPVRSDGLHFTPEGVQQIIAPWLLPHLANVARGTE